MPSAKESYTAVPAFVCEARRAYRFTVAEPAHIVKNTFFSAERGAAAPSPEISRNLLFFFYVFFFTSQCMPWLGALMVR